MQCFTRSEDEAACQWRAKSLLVSHPPGMLVSPVLQCSVALALRTVGGLSTHDQSVSRGLGEACTSLVLPARSAMCLYSGTPFSAAPALATAKLTARIALAPAQSRC